MRSRLEEGDEDALFEFKFQRKCEQELERMGINPESGKGLLFTFTAIAGGWETAAGRRLVANGDDCLNLSDSFERISEANLEKVEEKGYGGHPHRHANGAHPEHALNDLVNRTLNDEPVESMGGVFDQLEQMDVPFDQGMTFFKRIKTFGGLTAFDYLDTAARVNHRTGVVPNRLKPKHVDRNGPKKTLERTLSSEASVKADVQSEDGQVLLDDLVEYAKTELGLSHIDAIFDVESCLCTYHGELEDEGPDWRGSCT